jgi:hypothetical protein
VSGSSLEGFGLAWKFKPRNRRNEMGKYFLGWLLGIPVVALVVIYLIFNQ